MWYNATAKYAHLPDGLETFLLQVILGTICLSVELEGIEEPAPFMYSLLYLIKLKQLQSRIVPLEQRSTQDYST